MKLPIGVIGYGVSAYMSGGVEDGAKLSRPSPFYANGQRVAESVKLINSSMIKAVGNEKMINIPKNREHPYAELDVEGADALKCRRSHLELFWTRLIFNATRYSS